MWFFIESGNTKVDKREKIDRGRVVRNDDRKWWRKTEGG